MVDPDQIVSAVLAAGVAACFAYGYVAGRGTAARRDGMTVRADAEAEELRVPSRRRHCTAARKPRSERPHAYRSPGTAPPHARRRPRPGVNRNP